MFEFLAERRIEEAVAKGELDGLPGAGKPLDLDDDALIPEELRMAYRILKNAGYSPAEVRNPQLLQLRIDSLYYGKVVRKLSATFRTIDMVVK